MPDSPKTKTSAPRLHGWLVLSAVSLAMFGNYYIYDSISPLADLLQRQLGFSDSNIGLLNAIYSLPNIFMVVIGGMIIDRIGSRKATLFFSGLCLLGSLLTAFSGRLEIMALGRLLFGLGAESQIIAVQTAIARWFKGKELSFAFGLNLTFARLGSFAALNSPSWARPLYSEWQNPLLLASAFGLASVSGALIYWFLESFAEKRYLVSSDGSADKVCWRELFLFGHAYWYIVALCITFYSGIFPFQTFAVKFFMEGHGISRETGGFLSSILTLFAMIFTPLFGLLVDRIGRRALFMMIGSLLLMPVYLIMGYTHLTLYVPMAMMGIAFSLIPAIMWPSVAYVVEGNRLGTAYGVMSMIQNIGLAGFNLMIGWANDFSGASQQNPDGYRLGMWIFSLLGFCGFFFAWRLRKSETGPHSHGLEKAMQPAS